MMALMHHHSTDMYYNQLKAIWGHSGWPSYIQPVSASPPEEELLAYSHSVIKDKQG
jgi:hypothetical protein